MAVGPEELVATLARAIRYAVAYLESGQPKMACDLLRRTVACRPQEDEPSKSASVLIYSAPQSEQKQWRK